jgi:hypothetical protein
MAGLNHGKSYRRNMTDKFPDEEGVFFSEVSKKWVVRIKNNKPHRNINPFISIAQYDQKEDALRKLAQLQNQ